MKILRATFFLFLALILQASVLRAGTLRIALLADTEVFGDSILLSNLLSRDAPWSVRQTSEAVFVAPAPRLGTSRTMSSATIAEALETAGWSTSSFIIPERVSVKRVGRLVTREEIIAAIQSAVATTSQGDQHAYRLEDVRLDSAVRISVSDPGVRMTQMVLDQTTGCTWFRFRATAAPAVLPFYATDCTPSSTRKSSVIPSFASANVASSNLPSEIASPVLVDPGRPARLCLRSHDSEMLLIVQPLQRGRLGEIIRVRLAGTGKTLNGRVTGPAYLDAAY
jgi:hypothetical protein